MTPLEYMEKMLNKQKTNLEKETARNAPKDVLRHVKKKIGYYEAAVEALSVVRCKDCDRRNKSADLTDTVYCRWLRTQMRKTDFCSYGERKHNG